MRIQKETKRARHTHVLETAERGTWSGHGNKPTEQGTLTTWRSQRERLVRTGKETARARHTHVLETAEVRTCQDTERNEPSEAHSRPGDGRGRDLSGHGKEQT